MNRALGRKRLSGAHYRKIAKEKNDREKDVLDKTSKIQSFFVRSNTCREENENNDGLEGDSDYCNSVSDSVKNIGINDQQSTSVPVVPVVTEKSGNIALENLTPILSKDPAEWVIDNASQDYVAMHGFEQNKDADFKETKRVYSDKARYLSLRLFDRELLNGEKYPRTWLVYSQSKKCVYCGPCRLFQENSQLAKEGFDDWKNAGMRIQKHENSSSHKSCILALKARGNKSKRLDKSLTAQLDEEISYWRKILTRVVAVVKALASRALPLRGHEEKFGSPRNGNYLMALELISEFDPFLAEHIKRHRNGGSGNTSYMSSTVYEEFIHLMGDKVKEKIVAEIIRAKYYSIIVDSTPDISHVDQLSFVVRYVQEDGSPVERFLRFISNPGHKSHELAEAVTKTLNCLGVDIANCRGQSYDNASNMSGAYSGLQARLKQLNPLAEYVPCAAHSLNLVGTCAVGSCKEAVSFFGIVQQLYNFFTASTHRWEILQSFKSSTSTTLKSLSQTRWSAHADVCRSLNESWAEILEALSSIEDDPTEKAITRSEARGLRIHLERLETAFLAIFWGFLLGRFNVTSRKLQSVDMDVALIVELYDALIALVKTTRQNFDDFEEKAKLMSQVLEYQSTTSRIKRRKMHYDEPRDSDGTSDLTSRDIFRIETFFVILDCLRAELEKRRAAYQSLCDKFSVLIKLTELSPSDVRDRASHLRECFPVDLEDSFVDECLHFREHVLLQKENPTTVLQLCMWIREKALHVLYPNVDIAVRMLMSTAATNCSAERSFSCLRRVKNYMRSKMSDDRLNALAILSIESDILLSIPYDDIIDAFAEKKARRRAM